MEIAIYIASAVFVVASVAYWLTTLPLRNHNKHNS